MDPNACVARIAQALAERDMEEARYGREDLDRWLAKGGFAPYWDDVRPSVLRFLGRDSDGRKVSEVMP